jgi:ankyrin repeat protein
MTQYRIFGIQIIGKERNTMEEVLNQKPSLYQIITMSPYEATMTIIKEIESKTPDLQMIQDILDHSLIDPNAIEPIGYISGNSATANFTILSYACLYNNIDVINVLLQHPKVDPSIEHKKGKVILSPLRIAIETNKANIVESLLKHPKIDLLKKDFNGKSFFMNACESGNIKIVKLLMEHPRTLIKEKYQSPLVSAVRYNYRNYDIVKLLLEHPKIDPNQKTRKGSTALLEVCKTGDRDAFELLMKHPKIDPNQRGALEVSPIDMASLKKNYDMIKDIMSHPKFNPNDSNGKSGRTYLMEAISQGKIETIRLLLQHPNIDLNVQDNKGRTALIYSLDKSLEITKLLLTHPSIDPNIKDNANKTALIYSLDRNPEAMTLILNHPTIAVDVKNISLSPLIHACTHKRFKHIKKLLESSKINPNIQDKNKMTVLMTSVLFSESKLIELLLGHPNIDIQLKNADGKTAWDLASMNIRQQFPGLKP